MARADRRRYPDPEYRSLKALLARRHGVDPSRIAVGAGASEVIARLVGLTNGPVLVREPTFVEYRKAAAAHGRTVIRTRTDDEFLERLDDAALAFLCHPNNPDGRLHPRAFLERAISRATATGCRLALDLAYAPMARVPAWIPDGAEQIWAPNKPMDCAGVRAGYLVARDAGLADAMERLAPSWILSAEGVELLTEFVAPGTERWLESARPLVEELLDRLGALLSERGWDVARGDANFLVARPRAPWTAAAMAQALKLRGIRVRDAANMGMPGWLRLAARPDVEQQRLDAALRELDAAPEDATVSDRSKSVYTGPWNAPVGQPTREPR